MPETYKVYLTPEKVAADSFRLARKIYESDLRPDAIIGIWRGGAAVAAHVTGGLKHYGIRHQNFSATGKSYDDGIGNQSTGIAIFNMEELVRELESTHSNVVLGVDDVFDTGRTWHAFRHILAHGLKRSDGSRVRNGTNGHAVYEFDIHAKSESYKLRIPMTSDILPVCPDAKMATPYWKPHANKTEHTPDIFVETIDIDSSGRPPWVVFPWEAGEDLTTEELAQNYPELYKALHN